LTSAVRTSQPICRPVAIDLAEPSAGSMSKAPVLELEQEQAQKNLLWEARLGLIAWEPVS